MSETDAVTSDIAESGQEGRRLWGIRPAIAVADGQRHPIVPAKDTTSRPRGSSSWRAPATAVSIGTGRPASTYFCDGDLRSSNEDFVALSGADGAVRLDFQRVQNSEPITWPDPAAARRLHLDFVVDDLDEAEAHLCSMGARRPEVQPGGDRFRVLIDPAGHPFCLATAQAASTPSSPVDEAHGSKRGV
jgi:hypothetical protein